MVTRVTIENRCLILRLEDLVNSAPRGHRAGETPKTGLPAQIHHLTDYTEPRIRHRFSSRWWSRTWTPSRCNCSWTTYTWYRGQPARPSCTYACQHYRHPNKPRATPRTSPRTSSRVPPGSATCTAQTPRPRKQYIWRRSSRISALMFLVMQYNRINYHHTTHYLVNYT